MNFSPRQSETWATRHRSGLRFILALSLPLLISLLVPGLPSGRASGPSSRRAGGDGEWVSLKTGVLARLNTIYFTDENNGWAGGGSGTLILTSDGGETWKRVPLPEPQQRETIRDTWVFASGRSLVLGEYGAFSRRAALGFVERIFILGSDDRGGSWNEMQPDRPPVTEAPARIVRNSEKEMVIEPSKMRRAPDPVLLRMVFADDQTGWACGEGGTIQATRDGGRTWTIQPAPVRKLLYDISVVDAGSLFVAGAGGTLLQTEDGGQTWAERRTGVGDAIRAVDFTDKRTGWIATAGGEILVTYNGGVSWQKQSVPTRRPLNDILFLDAEGWAVGDNGTMLHTLDGGRNWQDESFDTHAGLMSIHFVSLDRGWIAGANGAVYRFTRSRKTGN